MIWNFYEFELPFPPSVNHYYRRTRRGVRLSDAGKEFKKQVVSILAEENIPEMVGAVKVEIDMIPPDDKKEHDIDNILKSLLDAMERAVIYGNDGRIRDLHIVKEDPLGKGCVIVRVGLIVNI